MSRISRERVLDALASGALDRKSIARALGAKGRDRPALERVFRELEREGAITPPRPGRARRSGPPAVGVIEVERLDGDGEIWGRWRSRDVPERSVEFRIDVDRAAPRPGDRVLAKLRMGGGEPTARVMKVLPRISGRMVGVIERAAEGLVVRSSNRRGIGQARLRAADAHGAEIGEMVLVELDPGEGLRAPRAKVIERLGDPDDARSVSLSAALAAELSIEFPEDAIALARAARPASIEGREDLRELSLVTIDGADARDFDDAVWARRLDDGWEIVVAIADVAHYVRPGDALDLEAQKRGNSVYFPDRVLPMLPEALSNGLCSLKPGEDRACLACTMRISADGTLRSARFARALMRSAARLTYEEVQAARDRLEAGASEARDSELASIVEPLYGAFEALDRARAARGVLELEAPEREVIFDEGGRPERIVARRRLESHRLIEEFMILANVAAARALEEASTPVLFRVHDKPETLAVRALGDVLRSLGLKSSASLARAADFSRLLSAIDDDELRILISNQILRAQARAVYQPRNIGHFGLALERYVHFTSPIRRYADLVVHRALIATFDLGAGGVEAADPEALEPLGELLSRAERRAVEAERKAIERFVAMHLEARVGAEFEATICGAHKAGLFVRLRDLGAEGLAPMSSLGDEYFHLDEGVGALVGERSRKTFATGDAIRCVLEECDALSGALRFSIVDHSPGPIAAIAKKRAGRMARRRGRRR